MIRTALGIFRKVVLVGLTLGAVAAGVSCMASHIVLIDVWRQAYQWQPCEEELRREMEQWPDAPDLPESFLVMDDGNLVAAYVLRGKGIEDLNRMGWRFRSTYRDLLKAPILE